MDKDYQDEIDYQEEIDEEERYYSALRATPEYWSRLTDELTARTINSNGLNYCSVLGEINRN